MSVAVKICGLTNDAGLRAAVEGGCAYVGFVFARESRHAITVESAQNLAQLVPASVTRVGLFVDADNKTIAHVLSKVPLDLLQLHGHETPERVQEVKTLTGLPVMVAVRLANKEDLSRIPNFEAVADRLLFDTRLTHGPTGGTGKSFDWTLLENRSFQKPWMLAGGLNAKNLKEAVRITGAKIVDVSSGVEDSTGQKDPDKIREFLALAAQF